MAAMSSRQAAPRFIKGPPIAKASPLHIQPPAGQASPARSPSVGPPAAVVESRSTQTTDKNTPLPPGPSKGDPSPPTSTELGPVENKIFENPSRVAPPGSLSSNSVPPLPPASPTPPPQTHGGEGTALKKQPKTATPMANMESETERNTRLNAAMFPSSSDSIQLYKNQNNSSDLLGRLYYDDFDSNDLVIPARTPNGATPTIVASSANGSGVTTPLLTPSQEKMGGPEYFSINPNGRPKSALVSSASSSSLDLPAMNASSNTSSNSARSGSARIKLDRGVSFDTVPQGSRKSYTIKSKHPQFRFRRNNKTWLFGFNNDAESTKALEWLFDGMIIHGDTLIILQVLDEKKVGSGTGTTAVTAGGIDKKQAAAHLQHFEELNVHQKKISIVFEVVTGKPEKCLKLAIEEYSPSMMVIGTHHYNPEKEHHRSLFGSSSISKHFLECALVPVIVVKPNYQYTEYLSKPIDSEDYFKNWMKNTELEHSHHTGSATINGDDAQLSASSASSAASQGSDKSSQGSRTKSFSRLLFGRHEH